MLHTYNGSANSHRSKIDKCFISNAGQIHALKSKPHGRSFIEKYRDAILFNKNLIIAAACGLVASTLVSQLYSTYDANKLGDSVAALATDYAVYLPVFGFLFYRDNRQKYIDERGRRNNRQLRQDLKKLLAAFSVSEVIYALVRVLSQYQLLASYPIRPYEAAILGEMIAWAVFFLSINLMARATQLFKSRI